MTPYLQKGGKVIGTEWIRRSGVVGAEDGGELDYMDKDVVKTALKKVGLSALKIQPQKISNDEIYESIIIWVGEKMNHLCEVSLQDV